MAEQMNELEGPYEVLDLLDGDVLVLRVTNWETGRVTIFPPHKPMGKVVTALRVHVTEETKEYFPFYYDLTAKTLVAQMLPFLERAGYRNKVFAIEKHGVAPKARFTVEVRPA